MSKSGIMFQLPYSALKKKDMKILVSHFQKLSCKIQWHHSLTDM